MGKVAKIMLMALLMAMSVEVALRIYHRIAFGIPFASLLMGSRDAQFQLSPFLVFGPRLDYQIENRDLPGQAYFDSLGFRTNEPVGPKEEGEFRILAVGGSTTENVWNEQGLHWPLVLECRLRDLDRSHTRVLNAGMSAYTTAHSLIRLQFDLLEHDPDMVLVMHNLNDLTVTYAAHVAGAPVDGHYLAKYGAKGYTNQITEEDIALSRLWRAVRSRLRRSVGPAGPIEGYDLSDGLRLFSRNLNLIADLLSARGIEAVFLTMPFDPEWVGAQPVHYGDAGIGPLPAADDFAADMEAFNDVIRSLADRPGIAVVDMAAALSGRESAFVDVVHYSASGVEDFGLLLANRMSEMVPPPSSLPELSPAALRRCAW